MERLPVPPSPARGGRATVLACPGRQAHPGGSFSPTAFPANGPIWSTEVLLRCCWPLLLGGGVGLEPFAVVPTVARAAPSQCSSFLHPSGFVHRQFLLLTERQP